MSLEALKTELAEDPKGIGYAGKTVDEILMLLNAKNRMRIVSLTSASLLAWSAANSRLANIWDASNNTQAPAAVRSIARAAALMLERDGTTLDLNDTSRKQLVGGLVQAGVLTQEDSDSLYVLATQSVSRLEELSLGEFHWGDVNFVLNGHPA